MKTYIHKMQFMLICTLAMQVNREAVYAEKKYMDLLFADSCGHRFRRVYRKLISRFMAEFWTNFRFIDPIDFRPGDFKRYLRADHQDYDSEHHRNHSWNCSIPFYLIFLCPEKQVGKREK